MTASFLKGKTYEESWQLHKGYGEATESTIQNKLRNKEYDAVFFNCLPEGNECRKERELGKYYQGIKMDEHKNLEWKGFDHEGDWVTGVALGPGTAISLYANDYANRHSGDKLIIQCPGLQEDVSALRNIKFDGGNTGGCVTGNNSLRGGDGATSFTLKRDCRHKRWAFDKKCYSSEGLSDKAKDTVLHDCWSKYSGTHCQKNQQEYCKDAQNGGLAKDENCRDVFCGRFGAENKTECEAMIPAYCESLLKSGKGPDKICTEEHMEVQRKKYCPLTVSTETKKNNFESLAECQKFCTRERTTVEACKNAIIEACTPQENLSKDFCKTALANSKMWGDHDDVMNDYCKTTDGSNNVLCKCIKANKCDSCDAKSYRNSAMKGRCGGGSSAADAGVGGSNNDDDEDSGPSSSGNNDNPSTEGNGPPPPPDPSKKEESKTSWWVIALVSLLVFGCMMFAGFMLLGGAYAYSR
jgi:hypothetical protein